MEAQSTSLLRIGEWLVDPKACEISHDGKTARLDFRAMRLLLLLAERAGDVVSIDELLNHAWQGVAVSEDSVYQAVTSLRRQLGDDPRNPAYIATVPRLGYRMVAKVTLGETSSASPQNGGDDPGVASRNLADAPKVKVSDLRSVLVFAIAVLCVATTAFLLRRWVQPSRSVQPLSQFQGSIAVLPFLDLTEGMQEETFADGMTEELIDRLSKVHGLQVPSPTASFFYKGKQIAVADAARALGVRYVLDGSVRKSGDRVRVAARLVRAENGYVIWTDTYDRPFRDILMVQDDISSEVTKALAASIGGELKKQD